MEHIHKVFHHMEKGENYENLEQIYAGNACNVNEVCKEQELAYFGERKYLGCHIKTKEETRSHYDRHKNSAYKIVHPRLTYVRLAFLYMRIAILFQNIIDAGYGLYARELHDPPYQELHTE